MAKGDLRNIVNKRRVIIALFLLLYLALWAFLFESAYWSLSPEAQELDMRGFVLGFLFLSAGSFLTYFIVFLVLVFNQKEHRKDYLCALLIILLPPYFAILDYY